MTALRHRLALVTAGATLLLILFGGLVTGTGSALAVPDWPTTFGRSMFTYPWSAMVGGVFYEHTHRLIGSLVGLLTLALAAVLWRAGRALRALGLAAVAAVTAQGVIGGLRVVLRQDTLAIVHGCAAPAFFGLLAAILAVTSPRAAARRAMPDSLRPLAWLAAALAYVQTVLGVFVTHAGALHLHLAGALAVFTVVPIVTARARRTGDPVAAPAARAVLGLLGLQLLLGVGAWLAWGAPDIVGRDAVRLGLAVAHRLTGSLIVGGAVMVAVRTLPRSPRPAVVPRPVEHAA